MPAACNIYGDGAMSLKLSVCCDKLKSHLEANGFITLYLDEEVVSKTMVFTHCPYCGAKATIEVSVQPAQGVAN